MTSLRNYPGRSPTRARAFPSLRSVVAPYSSQPAPLTISRSDESELLLEVLN
jgi:hypothetical protein